MTKPICELRGEPEQLETEQHAHDGWAALRHAAERVCWFDWSDNDEDAAESIDALRAALAKVAA